MTAKILRRLLGPHRYDPLRKRTDSRRILPRQSVAEIVRNFLSHYRYQVSVAAPGAYSSGIEGPHA